MLYGIIIAGGAGKRLWPQSRRSLPKYLLKMDGKRSSLKDNADLLRKVVPKENIFIFTSKEHLKAISGELPRQPKKNIIAEPVSRNTAPAICMAAARVNRKDPEGIIIVLPADSMRYDKEYYKEIFGFASLIAGMNECLLTIGIKPTYPATGFGYIKTGRLYKRLMTSKASEAYKVAGFTEKPALKKAKLFLASKRYLWNSGIFIGKAKTFLDEFRRYKPAIYRTAKKIEKALGTKREKSFIESYYKKFPDVSIDYAIMEKTKKAHVIKADTPWDDIGSWLTLGKRLKKSSEGNAIRGDCVGIGLKGSIIVGEKGRLIAAMGLKDIIIVNTKDVTLVCAKDRAEDIKKLVDIIGKKGLERYL